MNVDLSAATWKKAVRVFFYAFVAAYPVPVILGNLSGSQPVDVNGLRAAAVAGIAAVVALFWNAVMDPSPIPSLNPEAQND